MFERFTERARQVTILAQDEARHMKHGYIGTEHLLLGLLREEDGLAAKALESLGVTIEEVRVEVSRIVGRGEERPTGNVPFTARAKKVLELALREALALGHNYIGTEHILLGLVRENEGVAARILLDSGTDADKIRQRIVSMLLMPRREVELNINVDPGLAEVIREHVAISGPTDVRSKMNEATVMTLEATIVDQRRELDRIEVGLRRATRHLLEQQVAARAVEQNIAALEESLGESHSLEMVKRVEGQR